MPPEPLGRKKAPSTQWGLGKCQCPLQPSLPVLQALDPKCPCVLSPNSSPLPACTPGWPRDPRSAQSPEQAVPWLGCHRPLLCVSPVSLSCPGSEATSPGQLLQHPRSGQAGHSILLVCPQLPVGPSAQPLPIPLGRRGPASPTGWRHLPHLAWYTVAPSNMAEWSWDHPCSSLEQWPTHSLASINTC